MYPAYVSKHNLNCQRQVILLMIPNGEEWHYLAVKKPSALLRGIMSKRHGDLHCLKCLHSFATENKRKFHKKVCENVATSFEDTKILEFNQYQKSDKVPFIIYADLKCLIEKIDGCKSNPEISSTTKVGEHIASGFFNVYNIIVYKYKK